MSKFICLDSDVFVRSDAITDIQIEGLSTHPENCVGCAVAVCGVRGVIGRLWATHNCTMAEYNNMSPLQKSEVCAKLAARCDWLVDRLVKEISEDVLGSPVDFRLEGL